MRKPVPTNEATVRSGRRAGCPLPTGHDTDCIVYSTRSPFPFRSLPKLLAYLAILGFDMSNTDSLTLRYLFRMLRGVSTYETPMDPRRLRYFVVAAEEQNFTRAAERLRIAQPPLSAQIKQLEGDLGVELFHRTGRGVRLTEAGRLLLEEARRIFAQLDQTVDFVRRVGEGRIGRLALGFLPSVAHNVLPGVLREFRERFPNVELSLQEMGPDEQVRQLRDNRIDAGFLYLPVDETGLGTRLVLREPLVVALPDTHRLAAQERVAMRQLADEPFILPPRHQVPACYGYIMEACRRAGFVPGAVQKNVWLMQTIVGLVAGGLGVALVPASLQNLGRTGVAYRAIEDLSLAVELGAVWRRNDASTVLRAFLEVVEEIAGRGYGGPEAFEGASSPVVMEGPPGP
jgi:DNA-binding transcriptional LysR family regulator